MSNPWLNLRCDVGISRLDDELGGSHKVRIVLSDTASCCKAVELVMDAGQFLAAMMSHGGYTADVRINTSGLLGKIREHKVELVPFPERFLYRAHGQYSDQERADLDAIWAAVEVDGWKARRDDLGNMHNYLDRLAVPDAALRYVRITLTRHVDPTTEETAPSTDPPEAA